MPFCLNFKLLHFEVVSMAVSLFSAGDTRQFLNNVKFQPTNIRFTIEGEINFSLSFLGVTVKHASGSFSTSLYKKSSLSPYLVETCLNFSSFGFRLSSVWYRILKTYRFSSDCFPFFTASWGYLKKFYSFNLYYLALLNKVIVSSLMDHLSNPRRVHSQFQVCF